MIVYYFDHYKRPGFLLASAVSVKRSVRSSAERERESNRDFLEGLTLQMNLKEGMGPSVAFQEPKGKKEKVYSWSS